MLLTNKTKTTTHVEQVIFYASIKHQFHSTSTISIKTFNSLPTFLILGDQDWDRASFQIGESDLILLIMEGRLRHASVPAHYNIKSVTFIDN